MKRIIFEITIKAPTVPQGNQSYFLHHHHHSTHNYHSPIQKYPKYSIEQPKKKRILNINNSLQPKLNQDV